MNSSVTGALSTGLSVTTFLVGFSSIRLRGQRDRAVSQSDGAVKDLIRASSDGRALSDAEVQQSTHGFVEAKTMDPVAKGAVWFYWFIALLMAALCLAGARKSGHIVWNPSHWAVDPYVVLFLMILQLGICAAGTADYIFVQHDLNKRMGLSTLGIVDRAMAARTANDLDTASDLADELIARLPSWPWAYAFRGHLRAALSRPAEALQDFDRAVALRSDDPLARLARAEHRLGAGDAAGALEDLEALPSERQSDNAVRKLRGGALYKLGRRDEAVALFDRVVRSDPGDTEARVGRGEALADSGDRSFGHGRRSIEALSRFMSEEGERVALTALSEVGRENLSREDVETAIGDFTFALTQAPGDRRLLRLRADAYFRSGAVAAGEADYLAALHGADDRERAIGLRRRGLSRSQIGDGLGALADYNASLDAYVTHLTYFHRALQYARFDRYAEALSDIEAALTLDPDDADYLSHRAELLAATGSLEASEAAFRDVEIRFPANAHNYELWLSVLLDREALIDSLAVSARAVTACPNDPHLRLKAARVRSENHQSENALSEIDKAIDLGADPAAASYIAAQILADAGEFDEAEKRVEAAAEEPSQYQHAALSTRYTVRRRKGDAHGALEDITRAIELSPRTAGLWVRRACLRMGLDGATQEVLDDIEQALALNPDSVSALNHLSEYHRRSGDASQAIEMASRAASRKPDLFSKKTLADAYFAARQWEDAAELFAELARADSTDVGVLWSLAAAYTNDGRFAEAEATFSALTQLDDASLSARAGLAVTISQQGKTSDAVERFRRLREDFGAGAQRWMESALSADVLPMYDVVMADWEASGTEQ